MGLKLSEILMILVVVMLLFGANRLPALGQSLGSAIRNFKKGFQGEDIAPEDKSKPPPPLASSTAAATVEGKAVEAKASRDA